MAVGLKKTTVEGQKKFDDMCICLDTIPQRDGQTHGQTELVKQYCMLTRNKNIELERSTWF